MPEEVKIRITQESQGSALSDAEKRMEAIKARVAEINRLEQTYAKKGITGTEDLTKERTALQRELTTLTRERAAAERAVTVQKAEQLAIEKAQEAGAARRAAQDARFGRALGRVVMGDAVALGGVMLEDHFERQGVANRVSATRAGYDRNRAMRAERGFTEGEASAHVRQLKDEIFDADRQRPDLVRRRNQGSLNAALIGAGAGFGSGALLGAMAGAPTGPGALVTAALAALTGAGIGAYRGWRAGQRDIEENDAQQDERKRELLKAEGELKRQVRMETGREIEMKEKMLGHDYRGARQAEHKLIALREYNRILNATQGDTDLAKRGANLAVYERQREEVAALSGKVNARSGAGDIARLATRASDYMGEKGFSSEKIDELIGVVKGANAEAIAAATRRDFTQ